MMAVKAFATWTGKTTDGETRTLAIREKEMNDWFSQHPDLNFAKVRIEIIVDHDSSSPGSAWVFYEVSGNSPYRGDQ
ncbi:MAG TPA: hypothetical protein VFQ60_03400 [Patescibacteria group bacterium]|nr:hypothetical protein [Patescibacteria group bacterium]